MEIKIIKKNKKDFLDLLLLADEQENMIEKYLFRGEMFALYENDLKSICVVTEENDHACEIKNLATYKKYQGQGYASKLLNYIFDYYKDQFITMFVGTGDVPGILSFYEKNGFIIAYKIKNFFKDNYDSPIYEDGIELIDMVYLKKEL